MAAPRARARFRLYLITDRHLAAESGGLSATLEAALAAGAELAGPHALAVQLREKDLEARELYELATVLKPTCNRFGAPLIVNDRIDVAIAAGADGVHLTSASFVIADARRLLGPARLLGVSTHHAEEVAAAAAGGADFAVFGPVYDPLSKGAYGPPQGLIALSRAVKSAAGLPLYALGGINAARAAVIAAMEPGARPSGIAVIGAVFGTRAPAAVTRELLLAWPAA